MKLLVIGSGGREHAIAWRLAQSPKVSRVYVAPGNAGTAHEDGLYNVDITAIPELVKFAAREGIHATIVGPEGPLAEGIVDAFRAARLRIFGPTRQAAQLESSKDFAKRFMRRHNIPMRRRPMGTSRNTARPSSSRRTGSRRARAWSSRRR
jgi:phosphoribosylamine--glycine ligase